MPNQGNSKFTTTYIASLIAKSLVRKGGTLVHIGRRFKQCNHNNLVISPEHSTNSGGATKADTMSPR